MEYYNTLMVSLYVEDLTYSGKTKNMIMKFKEDIMKTFEMTHLSLMNYFLDIKVKQYEEGIFMSEEIHISTIEKI